MAIAFVQQTQNKSTSTVASLGVTWAGNTTTGNLILVTVGTAASPPTSKTATSVTDTQGNTYTRIIRYGDTIVNCWQEVWMAKNITGGVTPTVTANITPSSSVGVHLTEITGLDVTQPIDNLLSFKVLSSAAPRVASFSLPESKATNEFVYVSAIMGNNSSTYTAGTGFTNLQQQGTTPDTWGNQASESKVVSSLGPISGTLTYGANTTFNIIVVTLADITLPNPTSPTIVNNYQQLKVGDGMSTTEKIR